MDLDGIVQKNYERNGVTGCTLDDYFNQVDRTAGSFLQGHFLLLIKCL